MSNTNGLLSGTAVCYTGDVDSNIYLRKGEPIVVPSPLTVISADGTKECRLVETNAGLCQLGNDYGGIELIVGTNSDVVIDTNPTGGANSQGLVINRLLPNPASCAVKLDQFGALAITNGPGRVNIASSQGAINPSVILAADPFTGECTLANGAPNTLDGTVKVVCGPGAESDLQVFSYPGVGSGNGIKLVNATAVGAPSSTIGTLAGGICEIKSSGSQINMRADNTVNIIPDTAATGTGSLRTYNGASCAKPVYFQNYTAGVSTGGLTVGDNMLFGYVGPAFLAKRCLDIAPEGSNIVLGDDGVVGGCVVSVAGVGGQGRVYDTIHNVPPLSKVIRSVALPQLTYPAGSTSVTAPTVAIPGLVVGKSYLITGTLGVTRLGYGTGGAGSYVVPSAFSVKIQFRWTGASPPANNSNGFISLPVGNVTLGSPFYNEGQFISFTVDLGPCPPGTTGLNYFGFGVDNTVEFEASQSGNYDMFEY
jgi:hypothetical protein